jgi:hypothetical protein
MRVTSSGDENEINNMLMMSQRTPWSGPQNLKNNTGFGVIRIQVASKSTRAPLARRI